MHAQREGRRNPLSDGIGQLSADPSLRMLRLPTFADLTAIGSSCAEAFFFRSRSDAQTFPPTLKAQATAPKIRDSGSRNKLSG